MKKSFVFSIFLLFISCWSWCQSVGIGTTAPDPSAQLDIYSTNKGLLIPRLSLSELKNIVNPSKGLMVYIIDDSSFYIHHEAWHRVSVADEVWGIKGNTGIDPDQHFIGNTDNQPVKFKINNVLRMQLDSAGRLQLYNTNDNLFIGDGAGLYATSAENYFIGHHTGTNNTSGVRNFFVGHNAGHVNSSGNRNIFEGFAAGNQNTVGSQNYFSGYMSGFSNVSGWMNLFIGYRTGYSNTTAGNNQFMGYEAGFSNNSGVQNYFTGYRAGYNNTTGSLNQFDGYVAGFRNTTGSNNYFSGYAAGFNNTTGAYNYFSGIDAGRANDSGQHNLFLGHFAGSSNVSGSQNFFNGYQAGTYNTTGWHNHYSGFAAGYSSTEASNNFVEGYYAGYHNITGEQNHIEGYAAGYYNTVSLNHFTGYGAGHHNTTGERNYFSGYTAGFTNTTGSKNTLIGYGADVESNNLVNAAAIGYHARVAQSNSFVIGGTGADAVNVGIGTKAPQRRLDVHSNAQASDIAIFRSSGLWGQILVTDGTTTTDLGASSVGGYTGTNSAGHFEIRTASTTRMFFQDNTGFVGIGTSSPSTRLHVNGTITATAPLSIVSDAKYKTHISPLANALGTVQQLEGVSYDLKKDEFPEMDFPARTQLGFIAQQVEKIMPELVTTDANGNKSVSYTSVIPLLVEAIKEQQQQIGKMNQLIDKLIKQVNAEQ